MRKFIFSIMAAALLSSQAYADILVVEKTNGEKLRFDVTSISEIRFGLENVDPSTGGATWENGEDTDIKSTDEEFDYGIVKPGDYYYSDGSWSDGGFISYETSGNGSIKWATPKPAPVYVNPFTQKERELIGIVYSVDLDRMGQAEKDALDAAGRAHHGMVVSLKSIDTTQWDSNAHDDTTIGLATIKGTPTDPLYPYANADISGYKTHKAILEKRAVEVANNQYRAVLDASDMKAPESSTGWFVPSTGQFFDILRNLTGLDFSDKCDFYFTNDATYENDGLHFDWQLDRTLSLIDKYKENYVDMLNQAFSQVNAADKNEFTKNDTYFTSTSASQTQQYLIFMMAGKYISCKAINKSNWQAMRPVLAF